MDIRPLTLAELVEAQKALSVQITVLKRQEEAAAFAAAEALREAGMMKAEAEIKTAFNGTSDLILAAVRTIAKASLTANTRQDAVLGRALRAARGGIVMRKGADPTTHHVNPSE